MNGHSEKKTRIEHVTFGSGPFFTLLTDPEVPVKYGVRLPVSMTCGISGIYAPSDPFTMRWR